MPGKTGSPTQDAMAPKSFRRSTETECQCSFLIENVGTEGTLKCVCPRIKEDCRSSANVSVGILTIKGYTCLVRATHMNRFLRGRCRCLPGSVFVNGICSLCGSESFSSFGQDLRPCKPCPEGTINTTRCQFEYRPCPASTESFRGRNCLPKCLRQTFRNLDGKCVSCQPGQRVLNNESKQCGDTVAQAGAPHFSHRARREPYQTKEGAAAYRQIEE